MWWTRIANALRSGRLNREIDEELAAHLDEAIAAGRDLAEASRALGPALQLREQSRDVRTAAWLESLRADAVFGWRQLRKRKVTTAAAVLSLGLAIGACTSAFRLIDALLLRPLPVAGADRLYSLWRRVGSLDAGARPYDTWAYPDFRLMRAAARGQVELIAVSYDERVDLTYGSDADMEKAHLQYVSGWMFRAFGLRPAAGRLLTDDDDATLGAHPYAVLSEDYWARRFGRDPRTVGRTFRLGDSLYTIAGVVAGPFSGTETGTATDVFVPMTMNPLSARDDATWFRTLALVNPGVPMEPLRQKLDVTSRAFEAERAKGFTGMVAASRAKFLDQPLSMVPAAAGASGLQGEYRTAFAALAAMVGLVLLIACANVANLLTAQAAARAREMALRVSIGAGRRRLVQLMLVESAWLGLMAALAGAGFAWWSAPFVVSRINPPDNPVRVALPADWRVLGFGIALTLTVTLLFGLAPALRASGVRPASALRGGADPHARRRLMGGIVAAQVAVCFVVVFAAGLFAATFDRLSHRPMGFAADRVLLLETVARQPRPAYEWDRTVEHLRGLAGVESAALSGWALPGGNSWNGYVSIDGAPPGPVLAYFLPVSPGWLETMRLPLLEGRDFRWGDTTPGTAIVNQTFARQFFPGQSPVGRFYARGMNRFQIAGVVPDAPYRNIREGVPPVAFVPFHNAARAGGGIDPIRGETFTIRTASANPLAMAGMLRREIARFQPAFRVSNVRTEREVVDTQTVRERLLAMLALFFAAVAVLLAGIGLYGVLDYSVIERRREIGIRRAIGARSAGIARLVAVSMAAMVAAGAAAGLGGGMALARYCEPLLYRVKATEWTMLALPAATVALAAVLAALPAVLRAVRIDPARMLRAD
jgi:predicted permease